MFRYESERTVYYLESNEYYLMPDGLVNVANTIVASQSKICYYKIPRSLAIRRYNILGITSRTI